MDALPLKLSEASGVPFYRQIIDQVADLIRSEQLSPGEQLPSVRELAGQLLVSLITVRSAYADLERSGLIVRRQGHGTYVAEEVRQASRRRALEEARTVLADAIGRAIRLGLDREAIRELVGELVSGNGGGHA